MKTKIFFTQDDAPPNPENFRYSLLKIPGWKVMYYPSDIFDQSLSDYYVTNNNLLGKILH